MGCGKKLTKKGGNWKKLVRKRKKLRGLRKLVRESEHIHDNIRKSLCFFEMIVKLKINWLKKIGFVLYVTKILTI